MTSLDPALQALINAAKGSADPTAAELMRVESKLEAQLALEPHEPGLSPNAAAWGTLAPVVGKAIGGLIAIVAIGGALWLLQSSKKTSNGVQADTVATNASAPHRQESPAPRALAAPAEGALLPDTETVKASDSAGRPQSAKQVAANTTSRPKSTRAVSKPGKSSFAQERKRLSQAEQLLRAKKPTSAYQLLQAEPFRHLGSYATTLKALSLCQQGKLDSGRRVARGALKAKSNGLFKTRVEQACGLAPEPVE